MNIGPLGHVRALPLVATTEVVASLRSACWPLARLHRLPPCPEGDLPPVVLVHGYLGHADMFRPLVRRLYQAGFGDVRRVSYPSTRLTLDVIARRIDAVVAPAAAAQQVFLVGHSLGAVACRAYLKCFGGHQHVRRFVSLGGPHAGTALFRFTPRRLWDVLDPSGPWVRLLADGEEPVDTVVIRSRYDHQVLPPVRASLPGAREVVLNGHGHNGLLWSATAHAAVVEALTTRC